MNFSEAEQAIRTYFSTAWDGETRIAWPDLKFTKPNDGSWVRFVLMQNAGYQASIGSPNSNRFRRKGVVIIQVFRKTTLNGEATRVIAPLADQAAEIFLANGLTGVIFENVNVKDLGNDDAGWRQFNVTAEFQYDRIT